MERTLYEETEQHEQKHVKHLNALKLSYIRKRNANKRNMSLKYF